MDTYTALIMEDHPPKPNAAQEQLAVLLDLHRAEVVDAWIEHKHRLHPMRYQRQPTTQLRATTERQLSAVIEILTTGPHALSTHFLASICPVYGDADLVTTLNACLLLKDAALPVIWRVLGAGEASWQALSRLDECLRWIVQQHARYYEAVVLGRGQARGSEIERGLGGSSEFERKGTPDLQAESSHLRPVAPERSASSHFHHSEFSLIALEERDRLAREMHDNLAQALGVLKLRLTLADDLLDAGQIKQVHADLHTMKEIAAAAYTDAREAIFNLRTPIAAGEDFVASLRRYLARYHAAYGVETRLICVDGVRVELSFEASTQAIRIVQEALTNVRKHSTVNCAEVRIAAAEPGLSIVVEDTGRGFDANVSLHNVSLHEDGYGLHVMQERAASVGGHLRVDAQVGRGVRVELWLPLPPGVSD